MRTPPYLPKLWLRRCVVKVTEHPRWASEKPSSASWQPGRRRTRSEIVEEQDRAAGGHSQRQVSLADGRTATASVELKFLGGRRVYAYLRFSDDARTINRYIGEAPGQTREDRLATGWRLARRKGMLGNPGLSPAEPLQRSAPS